MSRLLVLLAVLALPTAIACSPVKLKGGMGGSDGGAMGTGGGSGTGGNAGGNGSDGGPAADGGSPADSGGSTGAGGGGGAPASACVLGTSQVGACHL